MKEDYETERKDRERMVSELGDKKSLQQEVGSLCMLTCNICDHT